MLGFPLELVLEMLQESIIEVLTTQVSVTSSSLDGEHTTADVEERNIEGSSSKIEDQNVLLGLRLSVKTICDSSSSGLVDDTENI